VAGARLLSALPVPVGRGIAQANNNKALRLKNYPAR
jgi:hypothetical protein